MLISRVGEASAGFLRGKLWEDVTHAKPLSMLDAARSLFPSFGVRSIQQRRLGRSYPDRSRIGEIRDRGHPTWKLSFGSYRQR
jgi:hypothetical protein